jgi:hypothetical protein
VNEIIARASHPFRMRWPRPKPSGRPGAGCGPSNVVGGKVGAVHRQRSILESACRLPSTFGARLWSEGPRLWIEADAGIHARIARRGELERVHASWWLHVLRYLPGLSARVFRYDVCHQDTYPTEREEKLVMSMPFRWSG